MKKLLYLLFLLAIIKLYPTQKKQKIKLYYCYTPSHKSLKENWLVPSLQDDYDLVGELYEQTCPSAKFLEPGWTKTTIKKILLIIRAVHENWGNVFIYSDVDIQFFQPTQDIILPLMATNDLVIQKRHPIGGVCNGFFACRANEKTLTLWEQVHNYMQANPTISDDDTLNRFIYDANPLNITWQYLPTTFFSGGILTGKRWEPGTALHVPEEIVLHHANWTVGIPNKIEQLKHVREIVEKRRNR